MLNNLYNTPSNTLGTDNLNAIAVRGDIVATIRVKSDDGEILCVVKDAEDVIAEAIAWPDGGISAMYRDFVYGRYTDDPVMEASVRKVARFAHRLHTTRKSRKALLAMAVEATHL